MANYNVAQSQLKQIQATNVLLQEKVIISHNLHNYSYVLIDFSS